MVFPMYKLIYSGSRALSFWHLPPPVLSHTPPFNPTPPALTLVLNLLYTPLPGSSSPHHLWPIWTCVFADWVYSLSIVPFSYAGRLLVVGSSLHHHHVVVKVFGAHALECHLPLYTPMKDRLEALSFSFLVG